MQLVPMSEDRKIAPTKNIGKRKLKSKYHLTRCEAGLNGLYIVMIRSTQRHKFSSSENDWKNRKNSEFDQHSESRYPCS